MSQYRISLGSKKWVSNLGQTSLLSDLLFQFFQKVDSTAGIETCNSLKELLKLCKKTAFTHSFTLYEPRPASEVAPLMAKARQDQVDSILNTYDAQNNQLSMLERMIFRHHGYNKSQLMAMSDEDLFGIQLKHRELKKIQMIEHTCAFIMQPNINITTLPAGVTIYTAAESRDWIEQAKNAYHIRTLLPKAIKECQQLAMPVPDWMLPNLPSAPHLLSLSKGKVERFNAHEEFAHTESLAVYVDIPAQHQKGFLNKNGELKLNMAEAITFSKPHQAKTFATRKGFLECQLVRIKMSISSVEDLLGFPTGTDIQTFLAGQERKTLEDALLHGDIQALREALRVREEALMQREAEVVHQDATQKSSKKPYGPEAIDALPSQSDRDSDSDSTCPGVLKHSKMRRL